jgi:uncharacterized protein YegP (UPF0339 family)
MATATTKAGATNGADRSQVVATESMAMEFIIVEDNGGDYHWSILDLDGNNLAWSPSFTSYERAEDAAGVVLAGVGSARLDRRVAPESSLDIRNKNPSRSATLNG